MNLICRCGKEATWLVFDKDGTDLPPLIQVCADCYIKQCLTERFGWLLMVPPDVLRELIRALGDSRYVQSRWTSAGNPELVAEIEREAIAALARLEREKDDE